MRFKRAWLAGNPGYGFDEKTLIREIDEVLHRERVGGDGSKRSFDERFSALPNGSFIRIGVEAFLVFDGLVYRWSPEGYSAGVPGVEGMVSVLTPGSVVNAFRAGYVPQVGRLP